MVKIERKIRAGLPQVGVPPYGQVHAHSTGNKNATAQNEADYMGHKNINEGFYTHVVGNGRIIQVANVNRGAYDLGGGWNQWGYASVELIESHKTNAEFERDYKIYVTLLRELAKEAKLPLTLDEGNMGVITHDYARLKQPYNGTDHVDPYPYLAKWGISRSQFKKDVENGFGKQGGNTVAKVNNRQKHIVLTGRVKTNGASHKKIEKYLKENKWNYTKINKDGQTRFKTGRFNQASAGKFKLEKWLADNNWSYQVLLYDGK